MIGRRFKLISAALLLTVVLSSGGAFLAYQSAHAFGLLESLLVRGVVRTISLKETEKRDRSNINKRRDAELAEVDLREQALQVQERNGWITPEDAARERERFATEKAAIEERAKRERQIVSFQTRNRIRENLRETLPDVIKAATGADPRAVDFLVGMMQGEKPLEAALGTLINGGTEVNDPRQQFEDLQATLKEVEKAAQGLKGAQGLAVRARIQQALSEASGIQIGDGEIPDDKLTRLHELESAVESAVAQVGDITRDLFPGSEGISRERFAGNERWEQLNAAVEAQEGSLAGRTIVSSIVRNAVDEAKRQADEAGITLTQEQLDAIAAGVTEAWVDERLDPEGGVREASTPVEDLVRSAINGELAAAGQEPLPEPEQPEVIQAANQPSTGGGAGPAPTTAVAPTATTAPVPTATTQSVVPNVPVQPSATTALPTATTAPVVTFSGSISEGVAAGSVDSLESTISLTINFGTGAVTGTISGSGAGDTSFPCSFPNGPTLDTAVVSYTSTYQGTFSGTYDPATGAISGSMSVGGNVSGSLTHAFTHPDCVHLNSEQIPGLGGWSGSGSFTGSFSESGGSISTNWTAGSASAGGSASLGP
jgi:hypothetical protein